MQEDCRSNPYPGLVSIAQCDPKVSGFTGELLKAIEADAVHMGHGGFVDGVHYGEIGVPHVANVNLRPVVAQLRPRAAPPGGGAG